MGVHNFENLNYCTIIITCNEGDSTHGKAARLKEQLPIYSRGTADRGREVEPKPVVATTSHPSHHYFECFDSQKRFSSSHSDCTSIQRSEVDGERQGSNCRSNEFTDENNDPKKREIVLEGDDASYVTGQKNKLSEEKSKSKDVENSNISPDYEQNIHELTDVHVIYQDPVQCCIENRDTCEHLQFTTKGETDDCPWGQNETLNKEFEKREIRQFYEPLKDFDNTESHSNYTTEYPEEDSTSCFNLISSSICIDSESFHDEKNEKMSLRNTKVASLCETYKENVTCQNHSDMKDMHKDSSEERNVYLGCAHSDSSLNDSIKPHFDGLKRDCITVQYLNHKNLETGCSMIDDSHTLKICNSDKHMLHEKERSSFCNKASEDTHTKDVFDEARNSDQAVPSVYSVPFNGNSTTTAQLTSVENMQIVTSKVQSPFTLKLPTLFKKVTGKDLKETDGESKKFESRNIPSLHEEQNVQDLTGISVLIKKNVTDCVAAGDTTTLKKYESNLTCSTVLDKEYAKCKPYQFNEVLKRVDKTTSSVCVTTVNLDTIFASTGDLTDSSTDSNDRDLIEIENTEKKRSCEEIAKKSDVDSFKNLDAKHQPVHFFNMEDLHGSEKIISDQEMIFTKEMNSPLKRVRETKKSLSKDKTSNQDEPSVHSETYNRLTSSQYDSSKKEQMTNVSLSGSFNFVESYVLQLSSEGSDFGQTAVELEEYKHKTNSEMTFKDTRLSGVQNNTSFEISMLGGDYDCSVYEKNELPFETEFEEPDSDALSTTACAPMSDTEFSDEEDFLFSEFSDKCLSCLHYGNDSGYNSSIDSLLERMREQVAERYTNQASVKDKSTYSSQKCLSNLDPADKKIESVGPKEKYQNDMAVTQGIFVDKNSCEDIRDETLLQKPGDIHCFKVDLVEHKHSHAKSKPYEKQKHCQSELFSCYSFSFDIDGQVSTVFEKQLHSTVPSLPLESEKMSGIFHKRLPNVSSSSGDEKVIFNLPRRKAKLKRKEKRRRNSHHVKKEKDMSKLPKCELNINGISLEIRKHTGRSFSRPPQGPMKRRRLKKSEQYCSLYSSSANNKKTKQVDMKGHSGQQQCGYCNLLLSTPNQKCKRHKQPRVPLPESNYCADDTGSTNRGNRDNSFKKELSNSVVVDSGISTFRNESSKSENSETSCYKNSEKSSDETFITENFSQSETLILSKNVSFTEGLSNENHLNEDLSCHFPELESFTTQNSSSNSENEIESKSYSENNFFQYSFNIDFRKGIKFQRKYFHWKRSAKCKDDRYKKKMPEEKGKDRDEGFGLKLIEKRGDISYKRKILKEYFSNKIQSIKSFLKEIHVEHRNLPVFGLGSYFDSLNNGQPPSTQERMQYEWLRLATFSNYNGNGNAIALARNGFYHDHSEGPSSTRCFMCEARNSDWERFDNVEAEHRRQSPNCPFHASRGQESVNIPISYENNDDAALEPRETTTVTSTSTTVTEVSTTSTAAVIEATRTLQNTQISDASMSGGESISQQPTEDPESRDRSLLAFSQPRQLRALGRTGNSYSTIIAPRRNNVAIGARSNVGIDPSRNGSSTSGTASQSPGRPSSVLGGPVGAGAFAGSNNGQQVPVSTTTESSQQSNVPSPAVEAAAGAGSGAGGRTDPTITVVVDNPKHPDYLNIETRVNSYHGWPDYLDQTARQMSEAGFFYVGVADFTRCFCCGGGLRNWEPGDDPMLEHTRWFPRCEYVNKLKGERYVAAVQRRHTEHMAEQQRQQLELAQRRDENRNPPDPMTTDAAAVMREMGYSIERTREAILAVRQQTGTVDVTTQQVLTWLLDYEERRLNSETSNTELGVRPPPSPSPTETSTVETSTPSTVVNTGTSSESSTVNTTTSSVSAGTTTSTVSSTSTMATAEVQQSGTTASSSTEGSESGTGNQQTGSAAGASNSSSSTSQSGTSEDKQPGASGGDSDEPKSTTEGTASSETSTKSSKKKNTKKKSKNKASTKPGTSGATGSDIDAKSLKAENEKLREMQTCKICMERAVNTTLLPCGHLVCCDTCAARLQRCPICRKRIKGTVKTFMS